MRHNSETGSNPKLRALFKTEIKKQMKEALNRGQAKMKGFFPKTYLTEMRKVKIMYSDGNQNHSIKDQEMYSLPDGQMKVKMKVTNSTVHTN